MTEPARMRPRLDEYNRPYWTAGAEGTLKMQKCNSCQTFNHPALPVCRSCQSEDLGYAALPGTGAIDTFTVNHQSWYPGVAVPYVIARVRPDGAPGVIITTNIVNCDVDAVRPEDKVRVLFDEQDGIWFPLFEKEA